jgi:hypothetical protein
MAAPTSRPPLLPPRDRERARRVIALRDAGTRPQAMKSSKTFCFLSHARAVPGLAVLAAAAQVGSA